MSNYTHLSALVPMNKQPAIHVKIIRNWKAPLRSNRPSTCLVIVNEKGTTIEATIPWDVRLPFGLNLKEDDWFEIYDFKLTHALGLIHTTKNKYHIILTQNSVFTKIQPIIEFDFLWYANYNTIISGLSHPKFCIDLCGAMYHVGPIEDLAEVQPNQSYEGHRKRIQFSMINFEFDEINCVAYGTVAEKLFENWFSSTAKVVVCVLKLWRIEWGEGVLRHLTNVEVFILSRMIIKKEH
ncbi:hypothetical protein Bca52824_011010 [Brassica carinata]|uniref:Replication protein A 70 kDa DNA-binding subunit B/D first OB fold domain-containing protein n=1 Tax=Brassica carinata TaxID=52824 RepID=A0A8X8BB93_BRACI|nr:hypothetical protein Bca52824_011010 [Brassica carinata]